MQRSQGGRLIMHIALQGCLKSGPIPYGLTADTGGHIRYLLELVEALSHQPEVAHQIIVTRAFDAPHLGADYSIPEETLYPGVTLWRCWGASSEYLPKEALWRELPAMVEALVERMRNEGVRPDVVHAHYADAGAMASRIKTLLGIPYVFTAHSLGATKIPHRFSGSSIDRTLRRRIRFEELALVNADGVVASSDHEAQVQYALYRHYDPHRTQVNPPGCNLNHFQVAVPPKAADEVDIELRRFLRRPDRPCLLAIARPVRKKNLSALLTAYGEDPSLRDKANLVIIAGTRSNIAQQENEMREVWDQLITLIDRYDLYGDVAYPKHHEFQHIPAIYQWAASRRGIFVNAALSEPFGLTLLESAAAGLPVIATKEGGPVDILRRCQHGILVTPTDIPALAEACHHLLDDKLAWARHSSRGRRNVDFYSWSRHATQYLQAVSRLPRQGSRNERHVTSLLATDMDGTLLGHREGLAQLKGWLHRNPHCLFVVATGRSAGKALNELEAWDAPRPDVLICDVGSSIYLLQNRKAPVFLHSWQRKLNEGWQRTACQRLLDDHPGLTRQPPRTQSPYKLSYYIRKAYHDADGRSVRKLARSIEELLASNGVPARIVCSHGNLLDALPPNGGKANAVDFIRGYYGIDRACVITAGDSGNDLDLLRYGAVGIAVANHSGELTPLRLHPTIYWASGKSAAGIMEGLHHSPLNPPPARLNTHPPVPTGLSGTGEFNTGA